MVIAAAALAIAGAAVIILSANRPSPSRGEYYNSYPTGSSIEPWCPNPVTMLFKTDEAMLQTARQLERDSRFSNTIRETKALNYERFKRTFADQPELIALTKPETMPASITLWMTDSSFGRSTLLAELKSTYTPADVQDLCEITATTTTPPPR
jgi:hypothetical protein